MALVASLALTAIAAQAIAPDTTDPRAIMNAVFKRDTGNKMHARMSLTIKEGSAPERMRTIETRSIQFKEGTKTLMLFESPADLRNTGFLSIDYEDGKKDDDQWLYLPSLHKSTRIAASGRSGSFMGSDFTYADLTKADPADYEFKMIDASTDVGGERCWQILSKPITRKAEDETGYVDAIMWVSKDKLMPLQIKARVRAGRKVKYIKAQDVEKIGGVWIARTATARVMRNDELLSESVIRFTEVAFDDPRIAESDFTERRLEKGL